MTTLRDAVRDVAPAQPLFGIRTLEQVLGQSVALRRFLMLLVGIFAGIAVLLGIVGVYGVLAYLVGQRRQEIAVRIALGATRSEIVWFIGSHVLKINNINACVSRLTALRVTLDVQQLAACRPHWTVFATARGR